MPTVRIRAVERYPDFELNDGPMGREVELTDEELASVKAAEEQYDAVQAMLCTRMGWIR